MKRKGKKMVLCTLAAAALSILASASYRSLPAAAEKQGTDGNEVQVAEPEELKIRLGQEWAGTVFLLETDAGKYPGTITVGEDGVLWTQIGGSRHYLLSVKGTGESGREQEAGDHEGETGETEESGIEDGAAAEDGADPRDDVRGQEAEAVSAGAVSGAATDAGNRSAGKGTKSRTDIPRKTLVLFVAGMAAAVGGLIALHFVQKRESGPEEYDDEDEYDDLEE